MGEVDSSLTTAFSTGLEGIYLYQAPATDSPQPLLAPESAVTALIRGHGDGVLEYSLRFRFRFQTSSTRAGSLVLDSSPRCAPSFCPLHHTPPPSSGRHACSRNDGGSAMERAGRWGNSARSTTHQLAGIQPISYGTWSTKRP